MTCLIITWLATLAFALCLCRAAAKADRAAEEAWRRINR